MSLTNLTKIERGIKNVYYIYSNKNKKRDKEKDNSQRKIYKINKGMEEKRQKGSVLFSCKLDYIPIQNISICIW